MRCEPDTGTYPKGHTVSANETKTLCLERQDIRGDRNHTYFPRSEIASPGGA